MKIYIYGLFDPRQPDTIRYVGQTQNPTSRLMSHGSSKYDKSPRSKWICDMKKDGVLPCMKILEETVGHLANERERFWFESFPRQQLVSSKCIPHKRKDRGVIVADGLAPLKEALNAVEKECVVSALAVCRWRISHAAARLCISRPTLYGLIEKHGIERPKEHKWKISERIS